MSKTLIIIVIVIVVVGGGYWVYQSITPSGEPTKEGQITEDRIAGWKTYRNEEYGFEIKYPDSWLAREFVSNPGQIFGIVFSEKEGTEKSVDVQIFAFSETIEDFTKGAEKVTDVRERFSVGNYPALLLGPEGAMGGSLRIFKDGKMFGISCHYSALETWREMFPTFKFLQ